MLVCLSTAGSTSARSMSSCGLACCRVSVHRHSGLSAGVQCEHICALHGFDRRHPSLLAEPEQCAPALMQIAPRMQPMLRASAACPAHAAMFAWHLVRLATCLAKWMLSTRRMTTGGEPVERFPMPSVRRVASELQSAAPAVRNMAMRVWCVLALDLQACAGLCSCWVAHAISWHVGTLLQACLARPKRPHSYRNAARPCGPGHMQAAASCRCPCIEQSRSLGPQAAGPRGGVSRVAAAGAELALAAAAAHAAALVRSAAGESSGYHRG